MENFHYFITYYKQLPTNNLLACTGQETRGVSSLYMRTSGGRSTVKNTNEIREIGPKLDWKQLLPESDLQTKNYFSVSNSAKNSKLKISDFGKLDLDPDSKIINQELPQYKPEFSKIAKEKQRHPI